MAKKLVRSTRVLRTSKVCACGQQFYGLENTVEFAHRLHKKICTKNTDNVNLTKLMNDLIKGNLGSRDKDYQTKDDIFIE